jgi:hypothetical protein
VPRALQGEGRHDAPDGYGALYVSEVPLSAVCEQLAPFRGRPFRAAMLTRAGLPLAIGRLRVAGDPALVDLDDPAVLVAESLRPSEVATGDRRSTQAQARRLFAAHDGAVGIRWWSVIEASWLQVTLFDVRVRVEVVDQMLLVPGHPLVEAACARLGLA